MEKDRAFGDQKRRDRRNRQRIRASSARKPHRRKIP
uniref:BZIP domain-containing protein n=1 Tax=Ascaris lumbricoides TaxID=6252 RepID=A0A0M3IJ34_ASCLU